MIRRYASSLFVLGGLLLSTGLVHAQTGKIAGTVTDAVTGEPLAGANVVVEGTRLGAAADAEGNYFILQVPPGTHAVQSTMIGFATMTQTDVRVYINQTAPLNFSLSPSTVQAEEVVVVAERPPVEVDLTGSKQRMSGEELDNSWVKTLSEALLIQTGTNIHGGIRGGFGLEDSYFIDGLSLRDNVSGGNLAGVNTTSIAELEVLTGGWSAEYGRAMGSVINIVTRSASDRIRGTIRSRYRPPGQYHWGRNIYSEENYEWKVMATLDYWTENTGGGAWAMRTPQERLDAWTDFITGDLFGDVSRRMQDYAERATWEGEGTFYGPITEDLGFLVSGKYVRSAPNFPAYLEYTQDWNYQGKLTYRLGSRNRLELSGFYQGFDNTDRARLSYWSSEDAFVSGFWGPPPYYHSGYSTFKYWPYGTSNIFQVPTPPEYMRMRSGQLAWTHVFNPSSFLDAQVSYTTMRLDRDNFGQLEDSEFYDPESEEFGARWDETMIPGNPLFLLPPIFHRRHPGIFQLKVRSEAAVAKVDYTNQISQEFQLKAGALISPQYVSKTFKAGAMPGAVYSNLATKPDFKPWDAAAYVQGKVEVNGMVINAGLRFDAFDANTKVAPSIFDPGVFDEANVPSYDAETHGVKTRSRAVLSPRFGISHPITELTVLHFSYGHFNQRPAWQLIGGGPTIFHITSSSEGVPDASPAEAFGFYHPNTNTANPELTFEKIIQYEIGFDQHIPRLAHLDVTAYYKDGKDLTSLGVSQGRVDFVGFGSHANLFGLGGSVNTEVYTDPVATLGFAPGGGRSRVTTNGGFVDVRGFEASIETLFLRNARLKLVFNRSFVRSGQYGFRQIFVEVDGDPVRPNRLHGVSLTDRGTSGQNNDQWNPTTSFKATLNLFSPEQFGPGFGNFYPLGGWHVNAFYNFASGHRYTYHSPGDFSTEPNNRRWKPYHNTNLRISKAIGLVGSSEIEFSVDVHNVLNTNRIRFPTSQDALVAYHEEDQLPVNPTTGEESEWDWYDLVQLPRQMFFGVQLNF